MIKVEAFFKGTGEKHLKWDLQFPSVAEFQTFQMFVVDKMKELGNTAIPAVDPTPADKKEQLKYKCEYGFVATGPDFKTELEQKSYFSSQFKVDWMADFIDGIYNEVKK